MKTNLAIITLIILLSGCTEPSQPKAVIVIVDGIPADVIERVATPNLDSVAGDLGYTRAYVGGIPGDVSESPTSSAIGYNSMLTGTWADKHNVRTNDVRNPDYRYWDIFRIAKNYDSALRTALFSTWTDNRTKLLGDGLTAAGGYKLDYYVDGFEFNESQYPHDDLSNYIREIDTAVADAAAGYIASAAPDLSWVYLQYTDDVGHLYGDSIAFDAAVQFMDEQVGKIWSAIESRQDESEDWLLLVTTDHGREAAVGKEHGGQSERERTTWIVTNSDRLASNFYDQPAIVDILPSVAIHLRLKIPPEIYDELDGQSFIH